MRRRRLLGLGAATAAAGLAGCLGGPADGTGGTPRSPARVTTSIAQGVEILAFQVAIAPDAAGPDAYFRLLNTAEADRTLKVETTLAIEGGGTYGSSAHVTVPAGEEVTLRYRIVAFDRLTEAERAQVRRGEGLDVTVRINGEARPDA